MNRVVLYSGGAVSWAAAKRTAITHGTDRLTLLFSDTLIEDGDLYRFLIEGSSNIFGMPKPVDILRDVAAMPEAHENVGLRKEMLVGIRERANAYFPGLAWIADGRTPHEVLAKNRTVGNTRMDPCSKLLKRELQRKWIESRFQPADTVVYVGMDWEEIPRFETMAARYAKQGWTYKAPMIDRPFMDKDAIFAWIESEGMAIPRLYTMGFTHNNCGGGCIKAGIGHWVNLFRVAPAIYRWWEDQETAIAEELGKGVAMLRDRRVGQPVSPLPLSKLRKRIEDGDLAQPELFDFAGCGCSVDAGEDE